jgi:hypothetical protein
MRGMARLTDGFAAAAALAASLVLMMVPAARAAPPRGAFRGHFVAPGGPMARGPAMRGPVMRGGPVVARGDLHFAPGAAQRTFRGPPAGVHFARVAPQYEGHADGGRRDWHGDGRRDWHGDGDWHGGGDWHGDWHGDDDGHFWDRPRYAVPHDWIGMHPDWDDGHYPGYWVRPWGPHWVPGYWAGGYWGGRFWPHVYLGWNFPWFLGALPAGCVTYWWGGVPYYYWQGVYYVWSPDYGQYVVTDPPPLTGGAAAGAAPPPSEQAQSSSGNAQGGLSLYVYPKNGQSQQQTENDRYQCHEWAVGQTGFDPVNPANDTHTSTATPSNYKRAVTACLEARGYSVR